MLLFFLRPYKLSVGAPAVEGEVFGGFAEEVQKNNDFFGERVQNYNDFGFGEPLQNNNNNNDNDDDNNNNDNNNAFGFGGGGEAQNNFGEIHGFGNAENNGGFGEEKKADKK